MDTNIEKTDQSLYIVTINDKLIAICSSSIIAGREAKEYVTRQWSRVPWSKWEPYETCCFQSWKMMGNYLNIEAWGVIDK